MGTSLPAAPLTASGADGGVAASMSEAELEALANDPRIKELQYKLASGADKFKLEVTNQKPQEVRTIHLPEGATPEEQHAAVQQMMRNQRANDERSRKEEERKKMKAKQERLQRSDVWCYLVKGAGLEQVNGSYHRVGDSVRNGARVYEQAEGGFQLTFECVGGGEGWIIGKVPRAFYAFQTKDKVAPEEGWAVQEHGIAPAPTVVGVEPAEAVDTAKQAGNAAFKQGAYEQAGDKYSEAIEIAAQCTGAFGLTDEVLAKLYANRAEAQLQLEGWQQALDDAEMAIEYDPCFVKAYVRRAKAFFAMGRLEDAAKSLVDALDVLPGNKEVLALQEEYRVVSLARSGEEPTLKELAGLCDRLSLLVKRKGMASEVTAVLKQMPTLLQALKLKEDPNAVDGRAYESCANHDAQVFLRLSTNGFAMLAPLIRPTAKQLDLLEAVLEAMAAATRDCPTNQVAFDRFVPQLVPILRHKASMPLAVLKAATKVLGAMAHRASARRVMHDPDTAEGLMHVLSFPDSSSQRLHIAVIAALDDMKDVNTIANLLAVPGACDTFWREAHSRNVDVQWPSRSLIATAMGSAPCRKRLKLRERAKRFVDLLEKIIEEAPVVEEFVIAPPEAADEVFVEDDEPQPETTKFSVRNVATLPTRATSILAGLLEGLSTECAADAELIEALNRHDTWLLVAQMCLARPPLSPAAVRLLRVCMQHMQQVISRVQELGVPMWLLRCREQSDHSEELNANVGTTMLLQAARDDALQIIGFVANHSVFHICADLFAPADVLHALFELLQGNPSDDASCAGCRTLSFLLSWESGKRRSALSVKDVHDVLVPLYLRKQEEAKDVAAKTLRSILGDPKWLDSAMPYFEEREAVGKLHQILNELNSLEQFKQLSTTGKTSDALRPAGRPLEESLEATHRLHNLQPQKVVSHLCRELPPSATIIDVGAGTGIFSFAFALALPESRVVAMEVRSDAIRAMRTRAKREQVNNLQVVRMAEGGVHALPDERPAHLVLLCDVLEFVPEGHREEYVRRLRALLSEEGRLVVIADRSLTDGFVVDVQDAGFVQRPCAQIVTGRRLMVFEPDRRAPPPPSLAAAPAELPEDSAEYKEPLPAFADGVGVSEEEPPAEAERDGGRSKEVDDDTDDEDGCCVLEENPTHTDARSKVKAMAGAASAEGVGVGRRNGQEQHPRDGLGRTPGGNGYVLDKAGLEADQEGECMLEENECALEENECVLEENECVLEENECVLEENGCVLEENECARQENADEAGSVLQGNRMAGGAKAEPVGVAGGSAVAGADDAVNESDDECVLEDN